ncbi:unnamed protein product [Triticum turgidum subsp. durum]|uniref:Uncharacterized protein n=1 Tax=Triticum turgidum subsp. durum TaxID=4567 RepID=A0A9R0XUC5_TRITD|nr:unnamed protein product [Triticum turgidum subsp. durum]
MAPRLPDQLAAVLLHPHPLSRFSTSSTLVDPRLLPSRPLSGSANRPPRFFLLQDPVMEGSSAMSPLGEPSIPMIAACAPALSRVRIAVDRTDQVSMEVVISLPAGSSIARKH